MKDTGRLLAALWDGPRPADDLADRLGIDPDAAAARVDELRDAGFGIERGEDGYEVVSAPEYGLGVAYGLEAFEVEYHESIGSTNDRARELAAEGGEDVVVLADRQTGGRGREGREWSSPPGGIYMSVLVRPALPPDRVALLTLAAAVGVTEAAEAAGVDAAIKWPNDVLADDGRKLSGILTEGSTAGGEVEWAVVGIGVNANVDPDLLPEGSTSLLERVGEVSRREVVQAILSRFDDLRDDPAAILDAWRGHAATLGRRVRIETRDDEIVGEAVDVDGRGRLRVETDDGEVRVSVGDCEHLRPA